LTVARAIASWLFPMTYRSTSRIALFMGAHAAAFMAAYDPNSGAAAA
jgi:hypothetical protein